MAIASLEFGTPDPIPAPPVAGKKLFLGADGKFKTVAPDGTVEGIGGSGGGSATQYSANPPSAPTNGDRWVDTDTLRAYEYVGGAWIEIL